MFHPILIRNGNLNKISVFRRIGSITYVTQRTHLYFFTNQDIPSIRRPLTIYLFYLRNLIGIIFQESIHLTLQQYFMCFKIW